MVSSLSKKRCQDVNAISEKANIVIVDIEGTTTSISFVKDVLFPYVRNNLESFLKSNWNEEEFQQDLKALKEQAKKDEEEKMEGLVKIPEGNDIDIIESVVKNVVWQMDLDRKTKALKQLQGHIWRSGYETGTLKGHLYSDVVPALKSWTDNGKQIYVYSSGSVEAQKLLFKYTNLGSILQFFSGHFDTQVGSKIDAQSYIAIAETLKCKLDEVVFFTDVPKEAQAAREAGMHAVLVAREGNVPLSEEEKAEFPVVSSLQDFVFEVSAKKRKTSSNEIDDIVPEKELQSKKSETCQDVEMMDVSSDSIINNKASSETTDEVSSSGNQHNIENGAKCKIPELNGDNSTCKIGANTVTGEENKNDCSIDNDFNAEKDHDLNNKTEEVLNKKTEPSKTVVLSNECNETKSEVLTEIVDVPTSENSNSIKVDNSKTEVSEQSSAKQETCSELTTMNTVEEKIVAHQKENESSITGQNGVTVEDAQKSQLVNQLQKGDILPEKTEETTHIKTDITDKSEETVPDNTEHSVENQAEQTETVKNEDGMLKNEKLTTVMTEKSSAMKTEDKENNVESVTIKTDKITTMKTEGNTVKKEEPEEATSVKTESTIKSENTATETIEGAITEKTDEAMKSENTASETIEGAIIEKTDEATANKTDNVTTEKTFQMLNDSASQNEEKSSENITASAPSETDSATEKVDSAPEKLEVTEEAAPEKVKDAVPEKVKDAVPEKVKDAVPEKVKDDVPEKVEDAVPENMEEAAPEKMEEDAPEKMEEDIPEKMEEDAPEKMEEDAPEKLEDAAPEKMEEDSPEKTEDAAPKKIEEVVPEKVEELAPKKMEGAAPEKAEEAAPEKMEETASEKVVEAAPKKMEEAAPEKVEEAAPEKMEEAAPEKVEEAAPEKMEEAAPEKVEEAAPEKMKEAAPEKVEEAAPEKAEEAAPEKMEEAAPEKVGEAAPEKVGEAAPEKMEEAAPEKVGEAAPEKMEEAAPEKVGEAAPEKMEKAAPEKVGEAAPEKMEEAAPEKAEEAAPEKAKEAAPEKAKEAAPEKAKEAAPEKAEEAAPVKAEEAASGKVENSSLNGERQLCELNGSKEIKDENVPKSGSVEMTDTGLSDKDVKVDPIVDNPTKLNNVAKEKIIGSDDSESLEKLPNICSLNGNDANLNKSDKTAQEDGNSTAQKHENVIENEKSSSVVSNGSNVEKNEIISN